jgi:sugar diacid utilization regulator
MPGRKARQLSPWQTLDAALLQEGTGGSGYREALVLGQEEHSGVDPASLGGASLGRLCADLGPELLEIVAAPRGLETMVTDIALYDPLAPIPQARVAGQLLLAVGLVADEALALRIPELSMGGLTAIAFRDPGAWPEAVTRAAETHQVSLLSVRQHVEWGELYDVLRSALGPGDLGRTRSPFELEQLELNDLFQIAEATAAIAGGPVTIEDPQSRILAFSSSEEVDQGRMATILNRRVPDAYRRKLHQFGWHDALLKADDVLRVELQDLEPRRAIAIRFGQSVLGSMWLAGSDEALSEHADEALRRAAPLAALHMMRQRAVVNVERRMREHRVSTLLRGCDASLGVLEQVGLQADEPLIVVALEGKVRRATSPAVFAPRLIDLLTMHLHTYKRRAVGATLEDRVFIVTSSRGTRDREALSRIAHDCIAHAKTALGLELRAGISHEVESTADLPKARRSAESCLSLAEGSVVSFEEVQERALLADVETLVAEFPPGPSVGLMALVEHDKQHESEYTRTLRCLLDSFGNASRAADQLHVHVNTVRYRIKRIAEITGVSLEDGDSRLALELELRAHRLHDS